MYRRRLARRAEPLPIANIPTEECSTRHPRTPPIDQATSYSDLWETTVICAFCKLGYLGPGHADSEGRLFCTPSHLEAYKRDHPVRCDCGCGQTPQITLGQHRFATSSCLIGLGTVT